MIPFMTTVDDTPFRSVVGSIPCIFIPYDMSSLFGPHVVLFCTSMATVTRVRQPMSAAIINWCSVNTEFVIRHSVMRSFGFVIHNIRIVARLNVSNNWYGCHVGRTVIVEFELN